MVPLSAGTAERLGRLFAGDDAQTATTLLENECAENLPFYRGIDPFGLERVRFAALRVSGGRIPGLRDAISLAKTDWRDLLIAARFAHDPSAHERWWPARSKIDSPARAWFSDDDADAAASLIADFIAAARLPAAESQTVEFAMLRWSAGDLVRLKQALANARLDPVAFLRGLPAFS